MNSESQPSDTAEAPSARLRIAGVLRAATRREANPSSIPALRSRHSRKMGRLRKVIGVPGTWSRSHDPVGLRFEPDGRVDPGPDVVFLHGGGYVMGSPASHAPFSARLARACARPVLALRYALAPERPFPAALEDVVAAVRTLDARNDHGVVLVGESAGGGLALAAAARCRDRGLTEPAGLVPIAPWTDLVGARGAFDEWAAAYAPGSLRADPYVSPARGEARRLPPTRIHVGTADPLVSQAERLWEQLSDAGVACELRRWPGGFHGFHHYPVPEASRLLREVAGFVRSLASARETGDRRSRP